MALAMSRDHRKLRVFHMADRLVLDVYRLSRMFPPDERFGLVSQLRRAAISAAVNIVEGCAREKQGEYFHFLDIALGSATEVRYLLDLSYRLGIAGANLTATADDSDELVRSLQKLLGSLRSSVPRKGNEHPAHGNDEPDPVARSPVVR